MFLTKTGVKLLIVSSLSLSLLFNFNFLALANVSTDDPPFELRVTDSGFYGTYAVGDVEYLYNSNRQPQLHESQIQRANGKT